MSSKVNEIAHAVLVIGFALFVAGFLISIFNPYVWNSLTPDSWNVLEGHCLDVNKP